MILRPRLRGFEISSMTQTLKKSPPSTIEKFDMKTSPILEHIPLATTLFVNRMGMSYTCTQKGTMSKTKLRAGELLS